MEPPGTAPGSSPVITSAFIAIAGEPALMNIVPDDGDLKGGAQVGSIGGDNERQRQQTDTHDIEELQEETAQNRADPAGPVEAAVA